MGTIGYIADEYEIFASSLPDSMVLPMPVSRINILKDIRIFLVEDPVSIYILDVYDTKIPDSFSSFTGCCQHTCSQFLFDKVMDIPVCAGTKR